MTAHERSELQDQLLRKSKPSFALSPRQEENRWWRKESPMSNPVPSIRYQSRRDVIERMAPRYREASPAQKVLLLDTVTAMTGYARKYAIRLLNQASEGPYTIRRRRLPRYGSEVQQA